MKIKIDLDKAEIKHPTKEGYIEIEISPKELLSQLESHEIIDLLCMVMTKGAKFVSGELKDPLPKKEECKHIWQFVRYEDGLIVHDDKEFKICSVCGLKVSKPHPELPSASLIYDITSHEEAEEHIKQNRRLILEIIKFLRERE